MVEFDIFLTQKEIDIFINIFLALIEFNIYSFLRLFLESSINKNGYF
jgi:hypothetical protein